MKKWFESFSKTARNILCIAPLAIGGVLIILYALYEHLLLLIFGIIFIVVFIIFLAINGKIAKAEKFKMSPEEEAEHKRKVDEYERKGEADAALIKEEDLDDAIKELQKLNDEKEIYYNRTNDLLSRKAAAYDMIYTNAKLTAAMKRKLQILKPNDQTDNKDD